MLFLAGLVADAKNPFAGHVRLRLSCRWRTGWFHRAGLTATLHDRSGGDDFVCAPAEFSGRNSGAAGRAPRCGHQTGTPEIMSAQEPLVFKFASEDWEFEQIHRLNYRTFVEEIPQHHASPDPAAGGQIPRRKHLSDLPAATRNSPGCSPCAATGRSRSTRNCRTSISYLPRGPDHLRNPAAGHREEIPRRARRPGLAGHSGVALAARRRKRLRPRHHFRHHAAVQDCTSTSASCRSARSSAAATRSSSRCMSRWKPSRSRRANFCARRPRARSIPAR